MVELLSGFSIGCHEAPLEKCLKITVNIMSAIIQLSAVVLALPAPPPRKENIWEIRKKYFNLRKFKMNIWCAGETGICINIHERSFNCRIWLYCNHKLVTISRESAASFSRMTSPHLELTQAGLALFPLCEDYLPDPPLDYDQLCLPCGSQQRRVDSIIITLWSLFG